MLLVRRIGRQWKIRVRLHLMDLWIPCKDWKASMKLGQSLLEI